MSFKALPLPPGCVRMNFQPLCPGLGILNVSTRRFRRRPNVSLTNTERPFSRQRHCWRLCRIAGAGYHLGAGPRTVTAGERGTHSATRAGDTTGQYGKSIQTSGCRLGEDGPGRSCPLKSRCIPARRRTRTQAEAGNVRPAAAQPADHHRITRNKAPLNAATTTRRAPSVTDHPSPLRRRRPRFRPPDRTVSRPRCAAGRSPCAQSWTANISRSRQHGSSTRPCTSG